MESSPVVHKSPWASLCCLDGELEETEEGRSVSCWKKASCVAIPLAVRGGGGPAEGDHGCRLGWR